MHPISSGSGSGSLQGRRPLMGSRTALPLSRLFCCTLFSLLLAPAVFARQAPVPTPEPFGEQIDIRAINVETVVTDRRGRRIPNLTAADFELLVDGRPTPLEFFLEVQEGRAVATAGSEGESPLSLPPTATPGDPVPQSYLVFIDELFSPIRERKAALKKLVGELDRLGPDDQMAVVTVGDRGLVVLSPWSGSKDQLAAALKAGWERTGYIPPFAPSLIALAEESMDNADSAAIGSKQSDLEALRASHFQRTVRAASQAQRAFADTPGRKVMLMISGNWVGCNETDDRRTGCGIVRPLTDTSNLLGYTVYPVRLENAIDVLPGGDTRARPRAGQEIRSAGLTSFINDQRPMAFAADETGGRLLSMTQRFLTHAVEDLSSYYWLGFSADAPSDGRRRSIEVRVKGQGYQVRTRSSYLPLSRNVEAALRTESALITSQPGSRSRPLEIVRHPIERSSRETAHLPVDLAIPVQDLTLVPEGEVWVARLELHTLAINLKGDLSPMATVPIRLSFPSEPKGDGNVVYSTKLAIRNRPQKIEIQLTDTVSGKALSAQVEVAAADLPAR